MGYLKLLSIAFIILKLCEVIDWSWWIVLAPVWINIILIIIVSVIKAFAVLAENEEKKKWGKW